MDNLHNDMNNAYQKLEGKRSDLEYVQESSPVNMLINRYRRPVQHVGLNFILIASVTSIHI